MVVPMSKIGYKEALAIPISVLTKMGLWPAKKVNLVVISKLFMNIVIAIITETVMVSNIIQAARSVNMKLLNWSICVFFPLTNLHIKALSLWINRSYFLSLLNDLDSTSFNNHPVKLNRHIQTIAKISDVIVKYFALVMVIFLSIFSLLPSFTNLPLMMPPPFDMGKFDVAYRIGHLLATSYLATMSATIDSLYMSLIALSNAQLDILRERLIKVSEDANELCDSMDKMKWDAGVWIILKECVLLHDTITKYISKLSAVLSLPLLFQYASGCFIICNTIIQITILNERDSRTIIGMCGYSGIVFAQMSFYHWLGNEIIFKSDKIIEASYTSNWYELDIRSRKCILLLMERAKRTTAIKLYDLVFVSLESLGVVYYSYFQDGFSSTFHRCFLGGSMGIFSFCLS
uniref:Odorant receptor n=1 Tax=Protaetia brevitarsis TaxID=348688 RepID=A0A411HR05_PROBE|nr:odorant receptor [Protaetia brevitarsis]